MASTKFVKKFERKSKGQTKDEFFVAQSKINIVSQYKEKVERMYHIDVEFEDNVEDGQWLNLVGEPVDRRNAKNYITALCNPGEVKQIQFPSTACADFTDPKILEQIEKQTNAVIKPLQKVAHFETSGTELAVTLAMSLMEELCGSVKDSDIECMGNVEEIEDVITISPATHNASNRLASVLKRALSQHSDGVCSMVDYEHAPASVQRVLVNCLQDTEDMDIDNIDDDLLFNDGNATNVVSDTPLKLSHAGGGEQDTANSMEVDGPQQHQISPGVGALSDKLTEATISKPPVTPLVSKQHDYLRSFGVSVGYKSEEVNEALQFVDEKTRPSDFLDLLGSVKKKTDPLIHDISNDDDDDVVILETETIDLTEDTPAAGGGHGASANLSDSKQGISLNADLPDGYKERLIMDFFQEDDNCSRDELKRRNAERQQLLRQNFKQQQQQKTKESGCKQTQEGQNAGKKKGKTKSQRKKQQKLNQQQQQQQQQKIENQKEKNDSQHDKQLRLDSSESQTFSNDDDQTCVFRLWNNGEGAQSGKNSEPIFTTPKRKKSQSGNNQRSNTQPITAKPSVNPRPYQPEQFHNPQVTNTFNQWSQPLQHKQNTKSHLPSRDNQWKPMQVVNPVNNYAGPSQPRPLVPPRVDGDELRYIVIDGSNVAMTHGNGKHFSCKGLRLCVDYFKKRGHTKITVFVPQWRTYRPSEDNPILDQHILQELKDEEILVFTPSRRIGRRLVVAYDDRFVLELAEAEDGIIVSNDQYRDLMTEKSNWRKLIEERLLMFSYVGDHFMPPNDPLGRDGPCLDDFLRKSNKQQYSAMGRPLMKNRYQYGNQYGQQSQGHFNMPKEVGYQQGQGQVFKTPVQRQYCNKPDGQYYNPSNGMEGQSHNPGQFKGWQGQQRDQQGHFNVKGQGKGHGQQFNLRSDEETEQLFKELRALFPETDQEKKVRQVLENHEREKDLTKLSNYCINVLFQ